MDVLGAGGSVARKFIKRHGDSVTYTNETLTVDTDTDWDDESYVITTVSYPTIIQRTRTMGTRTDDETGSESDAGYVLYLAHDTNDTFTFRDSRGDDPPTTATWGGSDYEVRDVRTHIDGMTVLEVVRQ